MQIENPIKIYDMKLHEIMVCEMGCGPTSETNMSLFGNSPTIIAQLLEVVNIQRDALEVIKANHNMTIMNESEEYMDGAHDGYSRQAEIAKDALEAADKILEAK